MAKDPPPIDVGSASYTHYNAGVGAGLTEQRLQLVALVCDGLGPDNTLSDRAQALWAIREALTRADAVELGALEAQILAGMRGVSRPLESRPARRTVALESMAQSLATLAAAAARTQCAKCGAATHLGPCIARHYVVGEVGTNCTECGRHSSIGHYDSCSKRDNPERVG